MTIETVKIVKDHEPGYAIINKADFDPKKHEIYDSGKDDLIEEAFALKVPGPDGKPAFKATIERWSVKRLQEAIATAKKAEA